MRADYFETNSDPGELHYECEEALGIPYPRDSQTFLVHDTSRVWIFFDSTSRLKELSNGFIFFLNALVQQLNSHLKK